MTVIGGRASLALVGVLVVLLALVAIAILPARTERHDPSGRKTYSKFLLVVVFLFVFSTIFAAYGVVSSLTLLIGHPGSCGAPVSVSPGGGQGFSLPGSGGQGFSFPGSGGQGFSMPGSGGAQGIVPPPSMGFSPSVTSCVRSGVASPAAMQIGPGTPGDRAARGAVFFGLLLLVSVVVVWTQGHAAARLFSAADARRGPPGRVLDAYLFSTSLVALIVLVLAAVGALYALFGVLGPGTFGEVSRGAASRELISGGVLAVLADAVMWWHVRHAWRIHAKPASPPAAPPTPPVTPPGESP